MLTIIGFIVLLLVGMVLVMQGVVAAIVESALTGKVSSWPGVLIFGCLGGLFIYLAVTNCPITITIVHTT